MFGTDRNQLRHYYCDAWHKAQNGVPLTALEEAIVAVLRLHPEYHALIADPDRALAAEFTPEHGATNPFLHLGMHLGLQEQVSTDRPAGILAVYGALCRRLGNVHAAEHVMMEALGETLWEAQRSGTAPDEPRYLERLHRLAGDT